MKGPRVRSPPTQTERAVHELLPALRRDAVDAGPQDDIAHAPLEGDMAAVDVRRCGLGTGPPIAGMPRDELGAFASSPRWGRRRAHRDRSRSLCRSSKPPSDLYAYSWQTDRGSRAGLRTSYRARSRSSTFPRAPRRVRDLYRR